MVTIMFCNLKLNDCTKSSLYSIFSRFFEINSALLHPGLYFLDELVFHLHLYNFLKYLGPIITMYQIHFITHRNKALKRFAVLFCAENWAKTQL